MTQPYKGVRDFYPEDQRVQTHIFSAMRRAVESFGYEEMNASILEPTELYLSKTSEEIVNEQTYTFTDRGDRSVTLRPEMTPTVARMVAQKKRELGFPLRWYSIQNLFRYERPQRGRLREHWQLNADIFGASGMDAEVEIIAVAYDVVRELGAHNGDFLIKIGSKNTVTKTLIERRVPVERHREIFSLIDRKGKIPEPERMKRLAELGGDIEITESADIQEMRRVLAELGIENTVFDPDIVRGFDYYTGMVFEIFDSDPKNPRALLGGGRYDNLVGQYLPAPNAARQAGGGGKIPAVGFGMGDVTTRDFLETHSLLPAIESQTHLYIAPIPEDGIDVNVQFQEKMENLMQTADKLRKQGMNVAVGMNHKKIADHIKAASKLGIPYFAAYGADEISSEKLKIKNLVTGEEKTVPLDAVPDFFAPRR